jgi:hypothetical protein
MQTMILNKQHFEQNFARMHTSQEKNEYWDCFVLMGRFIPEKTNHPWKPRWKRTTKQDVSFVLRRISIQRKKLRDRPFPLTFFWIAVIRYRSDQWSRYCMVSLTTVNVCRSRVISSRLETFQVLCLHIIAISIVGGASETV